MRERIVFVLALLVLAGTAYSAVPAGQEKLDRLVQFFGYDPDVSEVLDNLSRANQFSIIASREVRGEIFRPENKTIKEVLLGLKGKTIREVLDYVLHKRGFRWRFWDNCLYVGTQECLAKLWEKMHSPMETHFKIGATVNADFRNVDLALICKILRRYAGVEIRATENARDTMMLRLIDVPWERVLMAIVHLNGLRMIQTEFSILIAP